MLQNAIQTPLPYLQISEASTTSYQNVLSNETRVVPSFIEQVSRLEYGDKVRYTFIVSKRFENQFALIKGLIDFHRPKHILFRFNREEKSIEVRTHLQQVDFLFGFLQKVQEWLVKEVQFKLALKKVIQFEDQYKSQRDSIYSSLLGI
jgi:hypothetical protein